MTPSLESMTVWLRRLVESESPSGDGAACDRCAEVVAGLFREVAGAEVTMLPGSGAGVVVHARLAGEDPPVLILMHHDTVHPAGTLARFPFRASAGRIEGPGSYDMKAGIVQAAFAAASAPGRPALVLISTPDEETGSASSRRVIEDLARRARAVLVMEPAAAGGALKTARKGVADFEIHVEGRQAHAGVEPEKGVSAILELAHQVLRIQTLASPAAGTTVNVGTVSGGTAGNVVAGSARAHVDVRVATVAEADRVLAAMQALRPVLPGARLSVSGGLDRPPMERTAGGAALAALAAEIGSSHGFRLEEVSTGGASDGNLTSALGVPTLDGLGPDGGGAHTEDEHVDPASWAARTRLLSELLGALRSPLSA